MQEEWKDIIIEKNGIVYDYSGLYQISNMGRVKSLNYRRTGQAKILKASQKKDGYATVQLAKNKENKIFSVHRLVANAFIPNPDNLPEVNHKDENKTNNNVNNLEWCTAKYNSNYGTHIERMKNTIIKKYANGERKRKCSSENHISRKVVCIETGVLFDCAIDAAEWCGLKSNSGILKCCKGESARAGKHPITGEKLHWMYYEDWLKLQE